MNLEEKRQEMSKAIPVLKAIGEELWPGTDPSVKVYADSAAVRCGDQRVAVSVHGKVYRATVTMLNYAVCGPTPTAAVNALALKVARRRKPAGAL